MFLFKIIKSVKQILELPVYNNTKQLQQSKEKVKKNIFTSSYSKENKNCCIPRKKKIYFFVFTAKIMRLIAKCI